MHNTRYNFVVVEFLPWGMVGAAYPQVHKNSIAEEILETSTEPRNMHSQWPATFNIILAQSLG